MDSKFFRNLQCFDGDFLMCPGSYLTDSFYYNLPLVYRLAEYASVDLWWYSLDLQDFLNENDFGNNDNIFM